MVNVERHEARMMLASFAMFFLMIGGYYIMRSIRDMVGVGIGKDGLERVFVGVFFAMLALVPLFGWIVKTFNRKWIIPLVYGFFASNILVFWLFLGGTDAAQARPVFDIENGPAFAQATLSWLNSYGPTWAQTFFVWISVYNLFTLSVFWSLMSDLWHTEQAKRLFGFVAAGGTLGGIAGSAITTAFAETVGPSNLMLISSCCLLTAIGLSSVLRSWAAPAEREPQEPQHNVSVLDGAIKVLTNPFMLKIAIYIFIANIIATYFYLEQSRIVGETLTDRAERLSFFASRDLIVSLLTVTLELFVTGRIMQRFGLMPALTLMPLSAAIALICCVIWPTLQVIAAIMVIERSIAYAISNPAIKVLWTSVAPEDKYRCQNFVDTVVYRGGDAASGTVFSALGHIGKSMNAGAGFVALAAVPIAALWLWSGRKLAAEQAERSRAEID
jgi:ATP:ADP antiporter, AAA family